LSKPTSQ